MRDAFVKPGWSLDWNTWSDCLASNCCVRNDNYCFVADVLFIKVVCISNKIRGGGGGGAGVTRL